MDETPTAAANKPIFERSESNTVALIGFIMLLVAVACCGLLFFMANQLPDDIQEFAEVPADSTAKLSLAIVASTTCVITTVAMILCSVGFMLPQRPRLLAAIGSLGSLCLLLGLFGVMAVGILMNPDSRPAESSSADPSSTETDPTAAEKSSIDDEEISGAADGGIETDLGNP